MLKLLPIAPWTEFVFVSGFSMKSFFPPVWPWELLNWWF